ncbi:MAG: hypothetical protein KKG00_03415, partial [Bacteroidetes bacterium]|nr:hypothetical protein [Bacteroidota bacterium]
MDDLRKIEASGTLESFIPVWGSGKDAIHHFQNGNMAAGALYAGLAVSDLFLVNALGKVAIRAGGMAIKSFARKESINLMVKGSGGTL